MWESITLAFSLASLIGVKEQEAFQLQDNAATTFYGLIYIVLFAIPLVAIKTVWSEGAALAEDGGSFRLWWCRCLAVFFTLIPITPVDNHLAFAVKIVVVVVAANAIGVGTLQASQAAGVSGSQIPPA